MIRTLSFLRKQVQPRAFTGLLVMLVGLLIGVLGNLEGATSSHGATEGASSVIPSVISVWWVATVVAYTMIVFGFILLVAAVLRSITSALAAR
jgi:hypothetical protein